jgi:hypothetical protein
MRPTIYLWIISAQLAATTALAQETDLTQTPNLAGAGIRKSLLDQIGLGRGDTSSPDSSVFVIARDPFRSIARGRSLFQRKFTGAQGLGPRSEDGVGDIENDLSIGAGLADSCAACHGRPKGAAGTGGNVFTRPDSRDAPHLFGSGLIEMLADEITEDLRAIRAASIANARTTRAVDTRALVSKGISFGSIRARPNGTVDTSLVEGVDADLRVRPFFAQGGEFSLRAFIVGAFNAEMGIEVFDPDLLAASQGNRVVTPAGLVLDGALDAIGAPPAATALADPDGDGIRDELPAAAVDHLEWYLLNYFKPAVMTLSPTARRGRTLFDQAGCNRCHVADLELRHDRRVADVETVQDNARGGFNRLFATATVRFVELEDNSGHPTLKQPGNQTFVVRNVFTDLKRHDLGPAFHERNFNGAITTRFVTEPLWGVATTAPYGHDGRSINLREVILRHGGEALAERNAFAAMPEANQDAIIRFLETLVLFPPPDTASNLDPGNPNAAGYPQVAHGSITLTPLFNDPTDRE